MKQTFKLFLEMQIFRKAFKVFEKSFKRNKEQIMVHDTEKFI